MKPLLAGLCMALVLASCYGRPEPPALVIPPPENVELGSDLYYQRFDSLERNRVNRRGLVHSAATGQAITYLRTKIDVPVAPSLDTADINARIRKVIRGFYYLLLMSDEGGGRGQWGSYIKAALYMSRPDMTYQSPYWDTSLSRMVDSFISEKSRTIAKMKEREGKIGAWDLVSRGDFIYLNRDHWLTLEIATAARRDGNDAPDMNVLINFDPKTGKRIWLPDWIEEKKGLESRRDFARLVYYHVDQIVNSNRYVSWVGGNYNLPRNMGFCSRGLVLIYSPFTPQGGLRLSRKDGSSTRNFRIIVPKRDIQPFITFDL